jgi:ribosome-associated heat shock protein Hsp15
METGGGVRIDKWLWAARLYKTRSVAAEACRAGHVAIAGVSPKPAREVRVGEIIVTRHGDLTRTTRVLGLTDRRVGAEAVKAFAEDLTPASEYDKRRDPVFTTVALRPRGSGRPTKKDRRDLEKFF